MVLVVDEPVMLAAVIRADGSVETVEPLVVAPPSVGSTEPEASPVGSEESESTVEDCDMTAVEETAVPAEMPMNPSPALIPVLVSEGVDENSVELAGVDVGIASGLETIVCVCVVAYVPPRSSLIVLNAVTPFWSTHSKTLTVWTESSAEEMAVPCRICSNW